MSANSLGFLCPAPRLALDRCRLLAPSPSMVANPRPVAEIHSCTRALAGHLGPADSGREFEAIAAMTGLRFHLPPDRAVIAIAGEDRQAFLQGLISNDTAKISGSTAIYATLLTAQGRFLFDLFIVELDGRYLVDCTATRRADLIKRLSMYRLRSKVTVTDADAEWSTGILFGNGA